MPPPRQSPRPLYPWEPDDEVVAVETPEQITVEYRIAPFGARITAALLDQLLLTAILIALWIVLVFGLGVAVGVGGGDPGDVMPYLLAILFAFTGFVQVFYFVWFEVRREGTTPGKRRIGLRAVMADGHGLSLGGAVVRNLARLVDNFPVLWLVPLIDRRRRRLGDMLAGTLVVRSATTARAEFRYDATRERTDPSRRDFFFPARVVERLYPDDLNLVEHLLARLPTVSPRDKRERLVRGVAARYRERLGLDDQAERIEADPERFLFELFVLLKGRYEKEIY